MRPRQRASSDLTSRWNASAVPSSYRRIRRSRQLHPPLTRPHTHRHFLPSLVLLFSSIHKTELALPRSFPQASTRLHLHSSSAFHLQRPWSAHPIPFQSGQIGLIRSTSRARSQAGMERSRRVDVSPSRTKCDDGGLGKADRSLGLPRSFKNPGDWIMTAMWRYRDRSL